MNTGAFVSMPADPPRSGTLMVRSGGSVFFAALSLWKGWVMLANGREESIPAPAQWWDETAMSISSTSNEAAKRDILPVGQLTFNLFDYEKQSLLHVEQFGRAA